jgi:glycosidase
VIKEKPSTDKSVVERKQYFTFKSICLVKGLQWRDGYSDFKGLTSKPDYIKDLGVKGN